MAKASSRFCDSCGDKISAAALAEESALKYEDSYYCTECKADVLPLIGKGPKKRRKKAPVSAAVKESAPKKRRRSRASADGDEKRPRKSAAAASRTAGKRATGTKRAAGTKSAADGKGKRRVGTEKRRASADDGAKRPARRSRSDDGESKPARRKPTRGGAKRRSRGSEDGERSGARRRSRARHSSSSHADSDEDYGAEKKKLPLGLLVGGAVVVIALVIGIAVAISGGGGDPGAVAEDAVTAEKTLEKASKKAYAALIAKDEALADEPAAALAALQDGAGGLQDKEAGKIQKRIKLRQAEVEDAARDAATALQATVANHESAKRYGEALAALRAYPTAFRRTTAFVEVKAMRERLLAATRAEREATPLLAKAKVYAEAGDYQRAVGVLEGFDHMAYAETTWPDEIKQTLLGYADEESKAGQIAALAAIEQARRDAKEAARRAIEGKIRGGDEWIANNPFEPWFGDDMFIFNSPAPNPDTAWTMEDRILKGKAGAGQRGIGALTGLGSSEWKDYVLEVKYKVIKGGFKLGVRFNKQSNAFVMLEPEIRANGQWNTLTISVRGRSPEAFQELVGSGSKRKVKFDAHDSSEGGVAFAIDPHSEVHFKDFGLKVIPAEFHLD